MFIKHKLGFGLIIAVAFALLAVPEVSAQNCRTSNGSSVGNCADFISQYVPATVITGGTFPAYILMQNTGTTTWLATAGYKLGAENPRDNTTWGVNRWQLLNPVPPGGFGAFVVNLRAPSQPGLYNFQARVLTEPFQWFGAYTPNRVIRVEGPTTVIRCGDGPIVDAVSRCTGLPPQVGSPQLPSAPPAPVPPVPTNPVTSVDQNCSDCATFITQTVPTAMIAGFSYPVTITERNTGTSTWTASQLYRLGAVNPMDNITWGTHRIELPNSVPSGQPVTFRFNALAPLTPGVYNFQWSMVHDNVHWFGGTTENKIITVIEPTIEALEAEIAKVQSQVDSILTSQPCPPGTTGANLKAGCTPVVPPVPPVPPPPPPQPCPTGTTGMTPSCIPNTVVLTDSANNYAVSISSTTTGNNTASRTIKVTLPVSGSPRSINLSHSITPSIGLTVSSQRTCDIPASGTTCYIPITFTAAISDRYIVTFNTQDLTQSGAIAYTVDVAGVAESYRVYGGGSCGYDICGTDISFAVNNVNAKEVPVNVEVLSGDPKAVTFAPTHTIKQGDTALTVSPIAVIFDRANEVSPPNACIVNSSFNSLCVLMKVRVIDPTAGATGEYTATFTAVSASGVPDTFTYRFRITN